tara:strand:+ start:42 stop:314 length:273 start_codon:yes stop_codon:yes gene_type:complete
VPINSIIIEFVSKKLKAVPNTLDFDESEMSENLKKAVSIPKDPNTIINAAYAYISDTIAYSDGMNRTVYSGTSKKFRTLAKTLLNPYTNV